MNSVKNCDLDERKRMAEEYQSGMTLLEISRKHFVTYPTVINYLKELGVPRRSQHEAQTLLRQQRRAST